MSENIFYKNLVNDFLFYLENEKNLKKNSVLSYKRDTEAFFAYINNPDINEIGEYFDGYLKKLKKDGKAPSSVSRNIASLRGFFKYLVMNNIISSDPTANKKYEIKKKTDCDYESLLTIDEVDLLISSAKTNDIKGIRDTAIMETLYACGLKASELLSIKLADLRLSDGYIIINAQNSLRYAPVYKGAARAIREYIKKSRKYLDSKNKTDILFLNKDGAPLARQGLWKILKAYGKKANINKEITPHLFRQSMALHLVENGARIEDIKEILGHKDLSLTLGYVKNFKPKIVSAYQKIHPKNE